MSESSSITRLAAEDRPSDWSLDAIVLVESEIERLGGDPELPGRVEASRGAHGVVAEDDVRYQVANDFTFYDGSDEKLARIQVTFLATYSFEKRPPREAVNRYMTSVILQVTPFIREYVVATMGRLGVTPFFLPLTSADDVRFSSNPGEPQGQGVG